MDCPRHLTHPRHRPAGPRPGLASRTARRATGVVATLAIALGLIVAVAPAASAAGPVPYDVPFGSPAIPPGGPDEAYLDCPADAGSPVPVAVKDPNGVVVGHSVPTAGPLANSPGRLFVEVGSGGLFTASTLGAWTVTVDCPSYDPYETTFEVVTPTIGLEVTPDRDFDCTNTDGPARLGDSERMCWNIANTTGQDIRRYALSMPGGTTFDYPAAGEFPTGTSVVLSYGVDKPLPVGGDTVGPLFVWAELGVPDSGVFGVSPLRSQVFDAPIPAITVEATTGLTADTACPESGGLADRVVDPGTDVYFCYRVTNTSGFTFGRQLVSDDEVGSILDSLTDVIPDGSLDQLAPGPVSITAGRSRTVTWQIVGRSAYGQIDESVTLTGSATASVTVTTTGPTTTTTGSTTTVPPVSSATAPAAPSAVGSVTVTPKLAG